MANLGVSKAQALMMACLYHTGDQQHVIVSKSTVNALFTQQGGKANTTKVHNALVKKGITKLNKDGQSVMFTDSEFEGWTHELPMQD